MAGAHKSTSTPFPWPKYLTTTRVAEYTGKSTSTIRHAATDPRSGLRPAGRIGGKGELVFALADVERWMTGGEPAPVETDATAHATGDSAASLARIRAAAAAKGAR